MNNVIGGFTVTGTSYTFEGINIDYYYVYVRAINNTGTSSFSSHTTVAVGNNYT